MLDAIAEIDNLGMEDSTLAADVSATSLDTNTALCESQGSSLQETDFNQALMDMLSSLAALDAAAPSLQVVSGQSLEDALADAIPGLDPTTVTPPDPLAPDSLSSLDVPADANNPSLEIVSGQSLEGALADVIPGLDPTTVTPPDLLAQEASLNPFMMATVSELDNADLGKAFQTVSDGFEGLSDSFERLAASFLAPDGDFDPTAIALNSDDAVDLKVKNLAIDNAVSDTDLDTDKMAIADVTSDTADTKVDKIAIANDPNTINADFGIGDMISNTKSSALGTDFNLDFSALKVNVDQVSRGLQFLVQQLEAAFECDDLAPTTLSTFNSLS